MVHNILREISDFIFMEDDPVKSDIIIVPGSTQYEHVEKAAELFKTGYAKFVVPCGMHSYKNGRFLNKQLKGQKYEGQYETEAAYYKNILMMNGVPEENIICEDKSSNTFENAIFSSELLKQRGVKIETALLCCQAFHARRAYMTFARYFTETDIRVIPVETLGINKQNWTQKEESFLCVMDELKKCGSFFSDMTPWKPKEEQHE